MTPGTLVGNEIVEIIRTDVNGSPCCIPSFVTTQEIADFGLGITWIDATGTDQGTAAPLYSPTSLIKKGAAYSGVILGITPPGTPASTQQVSNETTVPIYVYPPKGAQLGTLATNAGFLLSAGSGGTFSAT